LSLYNQKKSLLYLNDSLIPIRVFPTNDDALSGVLLWRRTIKKETSIAVRRFLIGSVP
jgi:hypothetical protein